MKIAVRYQSRGGNTKAVAELLAEKFGVPAYPVETPLGHYVDLLFLGGGVYEWQMDKALRRFIEKLDAKKVGEIVCFSTTGYMNSTIEQIKKEAAKKNIAVNQNELLIKMLLKGHSWLGLEGGHLTDKQKEIISEFADKIKGEMR